MKKKIYVLLFILTFFFSILFMILYNGVYFENKIYKSILEKYERTSEIVSTLPPLLDEKNLTSIINEFQKTKSEKGLSEALSAPILMLNKIESKRLEKGYILSNSKKLNFFKHSFKDSNKKFLGGESERPFGSINFIDGKIMFITGLGKIFISNEVDQNYIKKSLDGLNFELIKNNLDNFKIPSKWGYERNFVKDGLIDKNDLYLFITHKVVTNVTDHFTYKILKADLSKKNLIFKEFFFARDDLRPEADLLHSAGRIINFDENNLLITSPDFGYPKLAQNKKSLFGKIIKINKITKNYKIFSSGHRNPQGLFLDKDNGIVLATEHGPDGGDEVNIIKEGKNYGWPIASYGTEGGEDMIKTSNHLKYGFAEPAFHFNFVNCGMSNLIKVPQGLIDNNKNSYLLSCLSGGGLRYGKALYHLGLDLKKDKLVKLQKIFINDRIRDIKLLKDKLIVLVLEDSKSLGFIY